MAKKPRVRRYAVCDITSALDAAGVGDPQRQQALDYLASIPLGRRPTNDSERLSRMVDLVVGQHLQPFTAAVKISPDKRTAKRLHRKYMANREAIEGEYNRNLETMLQSVRRLRESIQGSKPSSEP